MGHTPLTCTNVVGDTGIEPVTSSVSGKRATAAPIAPGHCIDPGTAHHEVEMGFEPTYTALQAAASPLGHSTVRHQFLADARGQPARSVCLRADDGIRTRDPHLGKVMLYH